MHKYGKQFADILERLILQFYLNPKMYWEKGCYIGTFVMC